ncbi:Holliday junction DNA helicase subunit RuvA [Poseidonocella pacifica]|uniref:Holliday junction branch migration complex subunit RuvA n=1 Tax=Poseidonocella pacifica TaxID=871651 RepID=A0A1I0WI20_9RHOB|nr:Holliday junction branch migration protein RuvA [Poseidonocella pacifica]SFA88392.1 Holliday junction DNA helicase subunit RuvA [Poseidonocella pacifica]
MIGKITGRLDHRGTDHVLIDVGGVGYLVYCSDRTLQTLPGRGEAVALYTDLLVREDLLQLFGFPTLLEKEWHRLLMTVQGVGAKASLAILSALGPEGVGRAIALGDITSIKAAKGIGPKTAQRIAHELKEKAPGVMALGGSLSEAAGTVPAAMPDVPMTPSAGGSAQAEALSALGNLGYAPSEAASAVAQAATDLPEADTAGLIRGALKLLAPKG